MIVDFEPSQQSRRFTLSSQMMRTPTGTLDLQKYLSYDDSLALLCIEGELDRRWELEALWELEE